MIYKLSFESNDKNDKLFREMSHLKKEELVYKKEFLETIFEDLYHWLSH